MSLNLSYSHVRANLAKLLDRVSLDKEVVIINRKNAENVAIISESELTGLLETAHLLRSPKNAKRLLEAIQRVENSKEKPKSIDELKSEMGLG